MLRNTIATVAMTTLVLSSSSPFANKEARWKLVKPTQQSYFKTDEDKVNNIYKIVQESINQQNIEQYKQSIQLERQHMAEIEQRKQQEQNKLKQYDRGGNTTYTKMEVNIKITYYTNINNRIQGGQYDKKGIPLKSHDMPVCALPSNIPYGSLIEIDGLMYLSCDTGEAIKWIDNNTMRVDIFIPDVTEGWINRNKKIETKKAILYVKNN